MIAAVVVVAGVIASAAAAQACRCAPRTLDAYVADAEIVFFGRVKSIEHKPGDGEHRAVRFQAEGSPFKGRSAGIDYFATAASTASCGVPVQTGERYLVFANRRAPADAIAWFDTCNGSRRFEVGAGAAVEGFIDADPRETVRRLDALRQASADRTATDVRTTATPRLPRHGDPRAKIVGLLELPTVLAGENGATPAVRKPVPVYGAPALAAPSGTINDARDLLTREVGYEQPAAIVQEKRAGWFRVALAGNQSGWVRADDAGAFHGIAALVTNRLTHLTDHWDGWIWPHSGAGHPSRAARRHPGREQPVTVVGSEEVGGSLWLHIELLDGDPCGDAPPTVVHAGWVPAYTADGDLIVWYYSRGC